MKIFLTKKYKTIYLSDLGGSNIRDTFMWRYEKRYCNNKGIVKFTLNDNTTNITVVKGASDNN